MRTHTTLLTSSLLTLIACGDADLDSQPIEVTVDGCCCDDTGSGGSDGGGDDGGDGTPIASTNLTLIDLGIVCDGAEATFTLTNEGDGTLIIEDIQIEGDWELVSDVGEVAAGSFADFDLIGGGNNGSITITTNDPNNPTLTVSLVGSANQPPSLSLGSIPPVFAPGASASFEANVSDDQGAGALAMSWESDVDGMLSTDGADAAGLASYEWDGAAQTEGNHTMTVTATDSCGLSVSESFSFCQNLGYSEETLDLTTWAFTGAANWDSSNNWLELTDTSRYIVGTAFQTSEEVWSDNVSISFMFFASGGSSSGADGLSLTAIDTTRMTTYQGAAGGAIGYGGLPGWSVEIDTWDNTGDPGLSEPTRADHVSFVIDGASNGLGEVYADIHEVEDGQWHEMQVNMAGTHLTVSIDGIPYIDQEVEGVTAFPAHVGFTAATGNVTNYHLIDALVVERFVCEGDEG